MIQQLSKRQSTIKELREQVKELSRKHQESEPLVKQQQSRITALEAEQSRFASQFSKIIDSEGAATSPSESTTVEPSDGMPFVAKARLKALAEKDFRIKKWNETINELEPKAAEDSHNSRQPPSSDGLKKKATENGQPKREGEKKPSGGQPGHQGRTMKPGSHPDHQQDLHPSVCPHCGEAIDPDSEWDPTGEKRQVLDENKETRRLEYPEYRAHSCICSKCGKRVKATFPPGVEGPIQFGPILTAKVSYLRVATFCPSGG